MKPQAPLLAAPAAAKSSPAAGLTKSPADGPRQAPRETLAVKTASGPAPANAWLEMFRLLDPPNVRFNLLVCVLWLFVGGIVAVRAPLIHLALGERDWIVGSLAMSITTWLVMWTAWSSLRILACTGQARWAAPFTAMQVFLFTLLFAQIQRHFGAYHFALERAPTIVDWFAFSLAQAFRAADVIDTLQAYGLNVQMIRPATPSAGIAAAVFRAIVDLFFLKVIFSFFESAKAWVAERLAIEKWLKFVMFGALGLFAVTLLVSALVVRRWRLWDLLLWLVENSFRVVDIFDLMEIFDWRLSRVPTTAWEGSLAIVFRFCIACLVLEWIEKFWFRFGIRWFRGIGLRKSELEAIVKRHRDDQIRSIVAERLGQIERARAATLERLKASWVADPFNVMAGGAAIFGAMGLLVVSLRDPGTDLMKRVGGDDLRAEARALEALGRLGVAADAQADELAHLQATLPRERRLAIVALLGRMGPAAIEPLAGLLRDADQEVAIAAARALGGHGSRGAGVLADWGLKAAAPVAAAARETLLALGADAVQPLIDTLSKENAQNRLILLADLDVYWDLRTSSNPVFAELAVHHGAIRELEAASSSPEQVARAAEKLGAQGAAAAPLLWPHLRRAEATQRPLLEKPLVAQGAAAAPFLAERLAAGDPDERQLALEILNQLGSAAAPSLVGLFPSCGAETSKQVEQLLQSQGASACPALADGLKHKSPVCREHCIELLTAIGASAAPELAERIKLGSAGEIYDQVLLRIGPGCADALFPLLVEPDLSVRRRAFALLGRLSPESVSRAVKHYHHFGLKNAASALDRGESLAAGELLSAAPEPLRDWRWRHLAQQATQRPFAECREQRDASSHAARFSADGEHLIIWGLEEAIVWDLKSDRRERRKVSELSNLDWLTSERWPSGHDHRSLEKAHRFRYDYLRAMTIPGTTDVIASTADDGISVIDRDGNVLAKNERRAIEFGCAASGEPIVVGETGKISLLRRDLSVVQEFEVAAPTIRWEDLRISDNRRWLLAYGQSVFLGDDPRLVVCLFDCATGKAIFRREFEDLAVVASFCGDTDVLAIADKGGGIEIWDCAAGEQSFVWKLASKQHHVEFSPGGGLLAASSESSVVVSPGAGDVSAALNAALPFKASSGGGFPDVLAEFVSQSMAIR